MAEDTSTLPPHATGNGLKRSGSMSQASETSQTAQEFIASQLQLEADAREALPYQFDTCTKPLGPLRQILFSCITCNPPPAYPGSPYTPAGVCYSCSISCHGEHELVELFNKRNFVCDCGTTRISSATPCTIRVNEATQARGHITADRPALDNKYNHNFQNRFCGCGQVYNAHTERGIMFQCLGLGNIEDGGCGEDWWHAECIMGLPRSHLTQANDESAPIVDDDLATKVETSKSVPNPAGTSAVTSMAAAGTEAPIDDACEAVPERTETVPTEELPPGFPAEDDFEHFICYKCTGAFPWIKRYSGTPGFLSGVPFTAGQEQAKSENVDTHIEPTAISAATTATETATFKKRKAENDSEMEEVESVKKSKPTPPPPTATEADQAPYHTTLPTPPKTPISLFLEPEFRSHFCRCRDCFPLLARHPQLLEEEETYEPPLSESDDGNGNGSVGTGSLLDRGEAALSNVDRVRAIEGVMVYNHLKDKVKSFLAPFAESGKAVGAEDIKAYFEKLRGDEDAIRAAAGSAVNGKGDAGGDEEGRDQRREQGGY